MTLKQDRKWLTHKGHTTQRIASLSGKWPENQLKYANSKIILLSVPLSSKQTDYTCCKAVFHVLWKLMSHNATPTWQSKHKKGQSSAMTNKEQNSFECSKYLYSVTGNSCCILGYCYEQNTVWTFWWLWFISSYKKDRTTHVGYSSSLI